LKPDVTTAEICIATIGTNCLNRSVSLNIPHPDPEESGWGSGQIRCPAKTGHGFAKRVLACFTRLSKSGYFLAGRKDCRQTPILRMQRAKVKATSQKNSTRQEKSRRADKSCHKRPAVTSYLSPYI